MPARPLPPEPLTGGTGAHRVPVPRGLAAPSDPEPVLSSSAVPPGPSSFDPSPFVPSLADLGWDDRWAQLAEASRIVDRPVRPARVVLQGQDAWRVHDGRGERSARARGRLRHAATLPVTGDWVLVRDEGGRTLGSTVLVEAVLPRRSALRRKVAGLRSEEQVIAANVDVVAVCTPADDVNPRRLERELTLVWDSGATPAVVVTKCDLLPNGSLSDLLDEVGTVAVGVDVIALSVRDGVGMPAVRGLLGVGRTVAVIGPSGVGKSTLGNALLRQDLLRTHDIREDGKGRHTTTNRELVPLSDGGMLLDTPGMREVALWAGDDGGIDAAFSDVDDLASRCRFRDCRHDGEPGCAVEGAVCTGELAPERLASWRKLQRELAHLARRTDVRARSEQRRAYIRQTRAMRGTNRP